MRERERWRMVTEGGGGDAYFLNQLQVTPHVVFNTLLLLLTNVC